MSGDAAEDRMAAYLRQRADRPFGDTDLASGQTLATFSRAGMTAADNLLAKAERALADGDPERASHFVDRAAALSWDRHEQTAPAAWAAGMLLFNAVTDSVEGSHGGDSRWLDAATATLRSGRGWGQSEMRHVVLVIRREYHLEPRQDRAIARAVADVPERVELRDATLATGELAHAVTSVLEIVRAYRTALAETEQ